MFRPKRKKIKDEKTTSVPISLPPEKNIKMKKLRGEKYIDTLYPNILICGRKASGKTVILYNLLKHCCDKKTKIVVFCPTQDLDKSWQGIKEMLEERGNEVIEHRNLDKEALDILIEEICSPVEEEESKPEEKKKEVKPELDLFGDKKKEKEEEEKIAKERPSRYLSPEIIFVFDDLGGAMRNQRIYELNKKNRHLKCMTIYVAQWITNLTPQALGQCDHLLLFRGINEKGIKHIVDKCSLPWDAGDFNETYKNFINAKKYNFITVDKNKGEFRYKFNNNSTE